MKTRVTGVTRYRTRNVFVPPTFLREIASNVQKSARADAGLGDTGLCPGWSQCGHPTQQGWARTPRAHLSAPTLEPPRSHPTEHGTLHGKQRERLQHYLPSPGRAGGAGDPLPPARGSPAGDTTSPSPNGGAQTAPGPARPAAPYCSTSAGSPCRSYTSARGRAGAGAEAEAAGRSRGPAPRSSPTPSRIPPLSHSSDASNAPAAAATICVTAGNPRPLPIKAGL